MTQRPEALCSSGAPLAVARVCQSFLNCNQQLDGNYYKVLSLLVIDVRHPVSLDFSCLLSICFIPIFCALLVCLLIYLFTCRPACLSTCLPICLPACLPADLSAYLPAWFLPAAFMLHACSLHTGCISPVTLSSAVGHLEKSQILPILRCEKYCNTWLFPGS